MAQDEFRHQDPGRRKCVHMVHMFQQNLQKTNILLQSVKTAVYFRSHFSLLSSGVSV